MEGTTGLCWEHYYPMTGPIFRARVRPGGGWRVSHFLSILCLGATGGMKDTPPTRHGHTEASWTRSDGVSEEGPSLGNGGGSHLLETISSSSQKVNTYIGDVTNTINKLGEIVQTSYPRPLNSQIHMEHLQKISI